MPFPIAWDLGLCQDLSGDNSELNMPNNNVTVVFLNLFCFVFENDMSWMLFSVRKKNQTGYNTGVPNISGCVTQFRKGLFNIGPIWKINKKTSVLFNKKYKDQYW